MPVAVLADMKSRKGIGLGMILVFGTSLGGCIYTRKPDTGTNENMGNVSQTETMTKTTETMPVSGGAVAADEAAKAAGSLQDKANQLKHGLHFAVGSSELSPEAQAQVAEFGRLAAKSPDQKIKLDGFTDTTGSESINMKVSESRAKAVSDVLIESGVKPEQITLAPKGAESPIASNDTAQGRAQNRRVEVSLAS